ncbi:MAG: hypothetical protein AABX28_00885 [Nanoarchaeota archaeon]
MPYNPSEDLPAVYLDVKGREKLAGIRGRHLNDLDPEKNLTLFSDELIRGLALLNRKRLEKIFDNKRIFKPYEKEKLRRIYFEGIRENQARSISSGLLYLQPIIELYRETFLNNSS